MKKLINTPETMLADWIAVEQDAEVPFARGEAGRARGAFEEQHRRADERGTQER